MDYIILGSRDIEMDLIEMILDGNGLPHGFAMSSADPSRRANPAECARGDWKLSDDVPPDARLILVELNPAPVEGRDYLVIDHHRPSDPPFPAIYQLATYLLGGERGLILGAADHDLAKAYQWFPAERVLQYRAEALKADLNQAVEYVENLPVSKVIGVLVGTEPSPSPLVGDVLIARGFAALVNTGQVDPEGRTKFVIVGATDPEIVEKVLAPFKAAGYETYATRSVGGVFVPSAQTVIDLLT